MVEAPLELTPLERAMVALTQGENEEAIRWAFAVLADDSYAAMAALVGGIALSRLGQHAMGERALDVAIRVAVRRRLFPTLLVGMLECRANGYDLSAHVDRIAATRALPDALASSPPPPLVTVDNTKRLSMPGVKLFPVVEGILVDSLKAAHDAPRASTATGWIELSVNEVMALIRELSVEYVLPDAVVTQEGEPGDAVYWVARGQLDVLRSVGEGKTRRVALLNAGSMFGELALLTHAPRVATVRVARPTVLVRMPKAALRRLLPDHAWLSERLVETARSRLLANMVSSGEGVLGALSHETRVALLQACEMRILERGQRFVTSGQMAEGLWLVASGQVSVFGKDADDPVLLATLGPGDVTGEVSTVLVREASVDVVCVTPVVALLLTRETWNRFVESRPDVVAPFYMLSLQRLEQAGAMMRASYVDVVDDVVV